MRRTLLVALAAASIACGSRGDPRAPLKKLPPPLPGVSVAQRGDLAIVSFGRFPQEITIEGAVVRTARVELLATSEQYPELTPEILAAALDRERRTRLREAREAAAMVASDLERRRQAAVPPVDEAVEGAEPEQPEEPTGEEPEEDEEAGLSDDELAFRAVPRTALLEWEAADLKPEVILDAAKRLQVAVDLLWELLEMPSAIVDLRRAPELPDPGTVVEASTGLLRSLPYETVRPIEEFLREAVVVTSVDYEDLEPLRVGDVYEVAYPLQVPGSSSVRTRYQLAVRGVSDSDRHGLVNQLLGIAPAPVANAPTGVETAINVYGVQLEWQPPAMDLSGRPLDASSLRYRLYRRPSDNARDLLLLTPEPIDRTALIDNTITWGETYTYEVRAEERPPWAPRLQIPRPTLTTVPAKPVPDAATATAAAPPVAPAVAPPSTVEPPVQLPTLVEMNRVTAAAIAAAASTPAPAVPPPASAVRRQSAPGSSAEVRADDTFPPPPISSLEAVRAGTRVTLRWDASPASDLTGYRVYRHREPAPALSQSSTPSTGTVPSDLTTVATGQAADEQVEIEQAAVEQAEAQAEGGRVRPRDRRELREQEQAAARSQRGRNDLVEAGWEQVTAIAIVELRYIDPASDPAVAWVYVVEALDRAGNVSTPVAVTVSPEEEQ